VSANKKGKPMIKLDPKLVAESSRKYRKKSGLSQRQLAAKILASPGRIGEMERGIVRSQRVAKLVMELANG
jgi:transcriptional regulator with XRE-family HTH domain